MTDITMCNTNIDSKILDWFCNGETGASSKCMVFYLTNRDCDGSYPCDGGDFERCLGLLKAVPELRNELHRMTTVNRYWTALMPHWQELENIEGYIPRSQRIREIYQPVEAIDKNFIRFGNLEIRFANIP